MSALVSIITPIYNSEEYISECIESVLSQTYENWEMILVDDCSTDNSIKVIEKYLVDKRIKLIKNKENLGPALTRNVALDNAKGDYISFLDSDDFLEKDKLFNQVNFMIEHNIPISHGDYHFCDLSGRIIKTINTDEQIDYRTLLKGNQFKIMTVMLNRNLLSDIKFKNIKHEDYILFLDILKIAEHSYKYSNSVGSFCRVGKVSVSSNKIKSAIWTWKVYRMTQHLSFLASLYYFLHYTINGILKHK